MKKVICHACGHENDEQANVCERCKAAIPHESNKIDEPVKGKRKRSE